MTINFKFRKCSACFQRDQTVALRDSGVWLCIGCQTEGVAMTEQPLVRQETVGMATPEQLAAVGRNHTTSTVSTYRRHEPSTSNLGQSWSF